MSPEQSKKWFLIDCGEGTQHQLLKTRYSLHKLEAIFITHSHGDHCYGLPGILAEMAMEGRKHPITLIGPKNLMEFVTCLKQTTYLNLSYEIDFVEVESLTESVQIGRYKIRGNPLSHRIPSFAYSFEEINLPKKLDTEKLNSAGIAAGFRWGQLQRGEDVILEDGRKLRSDDYLLPPDTPRKIVISGDNDNPELLAEACEGTQVLVHEATWTKKICEEVNNRPQHCHAEKIAQFAERAQIPGLVLTHFSPRYSKHSREKHSIREIKKEALEHYRGSLFLANDFDQFLISSDGRVRKSDINILTQ